MEIIYYLDLIGTAAFAVAGAFQGIKKRINILGVFIAGLLTAMGGGTLRDVFIFNEAPFWIDQIEYFYVAAIAVLATFFIPRHFAKHYHVYRFLDSVGLAVFMIIGVTKAVHGDLPIVVAMISGLLPAIGGGILRSISLGDLPPYVLRTGFYATPAIIGGALFLLLHYLGVPELENTFISVTFLLVLRMYGSAKKWKLPKINFQVP
ncbi:MAG: trimeric intracellular cation channel family protein [Candidatus Peregrinibacteria bacterium]|nr:trimeric intracellular cation channel family protein [Candidatus Peregrinibacteria bacterium]